MTVRTEPTRWQEKPVPLPLTESEPAPRPVRGCVECLRLGALRESATAGDFVDHSLITDCNVLLRMHGTGH